MTGILDSYFALSSATMQAKNKRIELISENIANVSTPGYKARDLDFSTYISKARDEISDTKLTHTRHMTDSLSEVSYEDAITYHQPLNPSLDNNTVEIGVEQAKFGKAAADYEASISFLENRISGIRRALRGE